MWRSSACLRPGRSDTGGSLWQAPARASAWTYAREAAEHLAGDYLSVYVPTTPNPTSGFFLMVPRGDVIELRMSVDEALKYIISMGVVAPDAGGRMSAPLRPPVAQQRAVNR